MIFCLEKVTYLKLGEIKNKRNKQKRKFTKVLNLETFQLIRSIIVLFYDKNLHFSLMFNQD